MTGDGVTGTGDGEVGLGVGEGDGEGDFVGAGVGDGVGEGVGAGVATTGAGVWEGCVGLTGDAPGRHCQYHSLWREHPYPSGQDRVAESWQPPHEQLLPPHWAHCPATEPSILLPFCDAAPVEQEGLRSDVRSACTDGTPLRGMPKRPTLRGRQVCQRCNSQKH